MDKIYLTAEEFWTEHEKYMRSFKGRVMRYLYRPKHWWDNVDYKINTAVGRARHGASWYDSVDLCDYLAVVIVEGTKVLLEQMHGHPGDLTPEEWKTILTKINRGFALYLEKSDLFTENDEKEFNEAKALLIERYGSLWD